MIKEFLDYLRLERNYSERTIGEYGDDLQGFESFFRKLDANLTWETIYSDIIRDWMESMMDKGNIATSINRRLSAVRSFYRFALCEGIVKSDPALVVKGPKKGRPLPQFLREEEIGTLLDGDGMWGDGFKDVRARTILDVFYETGIRLAELMGLDDKDIDFAGSQLKVTGKRNKQRVIPFGRRLGEALRLYINVRDANVSREDGALFVTVKGKRMNADQVRYEVKKNVARVSTLKKRSPHVLRHTFATAMLNHGAGIESVKKLLGHQSVGTTEIYTHTTFEQLRKVYNEALDRA